jgi:hypothetical protein
LKGVTILSSHPGHVVLAIAKLKGNPDLAREVEARLLAIRGITGVAVNSQAGEVEIRYEPDRLTSLTSLWALKDVMSHFFPEIDVWELAAALAPRT